MYKNYAEYRRQADEKRGHDNPFIALADAARMLSGHGEARAAQLVQQAHAAGGQGDHGQMAELLRAAARACSPKCAAEAQGLVTIADQLPEPDPEPGQDKPSRRRKDEDTAHMPALD